MAKKIEQNVKIFTLECIKGFEAVRQQQNHPSFL
jgi:hypothetical protein